MNRRTLLRMSGFGLAAGAQSVAFGARADQSPVGEVVISGTTALKLDARDVSPILSFFPLGEYIQERTFLVDGVYPVGTKETGRLIIRHGDFEDTITFDFVGEISSLSGNQPERRSLVDLMRDASGHVVTLIRSSYGTHRRQYLSEVHDSALHRIGDGLSGVLGEHMTIRDEIMKTDRGFAGKSWARKNPDSVWIPFVETTMKKIG